MKDCLFCKIIAGEVPSSELYEDEHSFAFLDIKPLNPGHALVIPKEHFDDIFKISEDALAELSKTVRRVAAAVKEATGADGINIGMNNGKAAGQEVFHAHIHIIPRFEGDGYVSWERNPERGDTTAELAGKIKSLL